MAKQSLPPRRKKPPGKPAAVHPPYRAAQATIITPFQTLTEPFAAIAARFGSTEAQEQLLQLRRLRALEREVWAREAIAEELEALGSAAHPPGPIGDGRSAVEQAPPADAAGASPPPDGKSRSPPEPQAESDATAWRTATGPKARQPLARGVRGAACTESDEAQAEAVLKAMGYTIETARPIAAQLDADFSLSRGARKFLKDERSRARMWRRNSGRQISTEQLQKRLHRALRRLLGLPEIRVQLPR